MDSTVVADSLAQASGVFGNVPFGYVLIGFLILVIIAALVIFKPWRDSAKRKVAATADVAADLFVEERDIPFGELMEMDAAERAEGGRPRGVPARNPSQFGRTRMRSTPAGLGTRAGHSQGNPDKRTKKRRRKKKHGY